MAYLLKELNFQNEFNLCKVPVSCFFSWSF